MNEAETRILRLEEFVMALRRRLDQVANTAGQALQKLQGGGQGGGGTTDPGAYFYTSAGLTAASGSTLGTGSAVFCTRVGTALTATANSVTIYNAGGAVAAATYFSGVMTDGDWSTSVCPC